LLWREPRAAALHDEQDLAVLAAQWSACDHSASLERIGEVMSRILHRLAGDATLPVSLEITARGADKANALRRVCSYIGIDPRAVAAIGDGANDYALLQVAGTGVAMGHAPRAVRDAADWVTDTNDRDGVALAIRRLLNNSRNAPNDSP
jgi:hydroxymethylpyrimidine pyrophosphatase-like HAD family hydrolase